MPLRADEFAANIKHLFIPNKYTSNFSSIFSWVGLQSQSMPAPRTDDGKHA